jgi:hypothetical protein
MPDLESFERGACLQLRMLWLVGSRPTSIREPFEVSMGKIRTAYLRKAPKYSLLKGICRVRAGDNNRLDSCYCMKCPSTEILDGKNTLTGFNSEC